MDFENLDRILTGDDLTVLAIVAAGVLILGGLLAYGIGWLAQRYLGRPDRQTEQIAKLAARLMRWIIMIIALLWALDILGLDVAWLAITILLALVIAFLAARPLAENLVSSMVLTTRPSFGVGDEIEIDGRLGEIIEFTDRTTVLRLRDGRRLHIPNKEVLEENIIVYTTDQSRRSELEVTTSEEADITVAETVILDALTTIDLILEEPAADVRALSMTEGIELSVRFWHSSDIRSGRRAVDQAIRAIKPALDRANIALAPSQEIRVESR